MQNLVKSFVHPSKELVLYSFENPAFVVAEYHDLTHIPVEEYVNFLERTGDFLVAQQTGRLLADFTQLINFPSELRAAAINNFKRLIADRIPYLLLAMVTPKEALLNPTLEIAVDVAKPLSRKFLDGEAFTKKEEALNWLLEYPVERKNHRAVLKSVR
jgi:hypothetical protein